MMAAQTHELVVMLKRRLRESGVTYRQVGAALQLSEASVKRLFSREDFTLSRLEAICQLLGIRLTDLFRDVEASQSRLDQLSEEQEKELVSDSRLLLVAFLVINGWQFDDIITHYQFTSTQTVQLLVKLDRLKLIELLPNNRIRLAIAPQFRWRDGGPIQRFFTNNLQRDFLKGPFFSAEEVQLFRAGMLTHASITQLQRRLTQIGLEFKTLNLEDRSAPIRDRTFFGLFLAFRPFRAELFNTLRRQE